MVYNAPVDTKELEESLIREMPVFQSDSKLDFEGFIVLKTPNLLSACASVVSTNICRFQNKLLNL